VGLSSGLKYAVVDSANIIEQHADVPALSDLPSALIFKFK
jgi:hypothetical protein